MVSAIGLVKCVCFVVSIGITSKNCSGSTVMKYDSIIGCFFFYVFFISPKIGVIFQFNSFNSPQILPVEWWDFEHFFGGWESLLY